MNEEESNIFCELHGERQTTFVCEHLAESLCTGQPVGFWCADDYDNPYPDAWCSECEAVVQKRHGEWDDVSEAFAGITLLCSDCYNQAKELNFRTHKSP
jgi:hypothetical protein